MSLIQVGKQIQTSSKIQPFSFQGNLLMGIANWFGTTRSVIQQTVPLTTVSVTIFHYFTFKTKNSCYNQCWLYMVSIQKIVY